MKHGVNSAPSPLSNQLLATNFKPGTSTSDHIKFLDTIQIPGGWVTALYHPSPTLPRCWNLSGAPALFFLIKTRVPDPRFLILSCYFCVWVNLSWSLFAGNLVIIHYSSTHGTAPWEPEIESRTWVQKITFQPYVYLSVLFVGEIRLRSCCLSLIW